MTTTRQRVNLILTDMEQRLLDAIVTDGTVERDVFLDYLRRAGSGEEARVPGLADVVHVLLKLGIERLEEEAAEISYAAEAAATAATADADRATTDFMVRRHLEIAARDNG